MHRSMLTASRFTEELNDGLHLSSREELRVGLVAYGRHGIPQAARELHLLAEEASLDGVLHHVATQTYNKARGCVSKS